MRSRFKVIAIALCTLVLTVAPALTAWGADGPTTKDVSLWAQNTSSGEMTASNQKYAKNGSTGNQARIDSFTLDGTFNYSSLGSDAGKPTLTPTKSAYERIVKNQLLPQWSGVAASVFRDQAGQLIDLYGYQNNGKFMSRAGFDAYFNMSGCNNDKYKGEEWSCYSLRDKLKQTYATHAGDAGEDQLTVSGVKQVSSLQEARKMMGQALYDCENHKGLTADEFLGVDEGGNDRLSTLDDDTATIGFANVVTAVNCKGSSADFDYASFGIVFYDFEAVPVAAKNLTYVSGAFTTEENEGSEQVDEIANGQQQPIVHTAKLGDDVKETTSVSLSALAGAKLDQSIGANIGWSSTEFGEDTTIGQDMFDENALSSSSSGWSETTSMGLNWGAAWSLAGAAGVEAGHSTEHKVSKTVSTAVTVPAHTTACINHKTTKTTYTQAYQQPVILNYKVAIFAISGDFYSGGNGGINSGSYDKQSLVIKFDTKEEAHPTYGCAATDDLYSRVVTNKEVANYDIADGRTYETHSDVGSFSESTDIDWGSVISNARSYYGTDVVGVAKANYFYETPGKLSVDKDKTNSSVGTIYPKYNLASVTTPKAKYKLYSHDTLNRAALSVAGFNKEGISFYGFNSKWGDWNRCDKDGNVINNGNLKNDDPVILEDSDTLVPKPGTNGGTIYLTWKIEDANAKPITSESPEGQNLATSNIETPIVEIEVVDSSLDNPKITMMSDSCTCFYKTPLDLNTAFDYEVVDDSDMEIDVQVKWESRSRKNISVDDETGMATFSRPGTYLVRPFVYNSKNEKVYPTISDENKKAKWVTIVAKEHNLTHCDAMAPVCTIDGCIAHYKCSDCGKFFSDAEGTKELSEQDVRVASTADHAWGDWKTVKEAVGDTPGEQQRVCATDPSHVETRALYKVHFDTNTPDAALRVQSDEDDIYAALKDQIIVGGASVIAPAEPTASGLEFEGWYADAACTVPYDFGSPVKGNTTVYAKWTTAKHTIGTMAVGKDTEATEEEEEDAQLVLDPNVFGMLTIDGGEMVTDGKYIGWVKEVEYGSVVEITAVPDEGYGLREIAAIAAREVPVPADAEAGTEAGIAFGDSFTPDQTGPNTYSVTMPDADVLVLASFDQVEVTFNGNAPANATVSNVPKSQKVAFGSTPSKPGKNPTATGKSGIVYEFGGWFTDQGCTKAYDFAAPATDDVTLYAKWTKQIAPYAVTITSAKSPLKNKVVVNWKAAKNADGYEVAIGGFTTSVKASKRSVSVVNTNLKAGTKYKVKVRAWHMNGKTKTYGSWSSAKNVTISSAYNAKTIKKVKAYNLTDTFSVKETTLKKGTTVKVFDVYDKWAYTDKGLVLKKNLKAVKIVNTPKTLTLSTNAAAPSTSSGSALSLTIS